MECILCGNETPTNRMKKYPICDGNHFHTCPKCGTNTLITNAFDTNGVEYIKEVIKIEDTYQVVYKGNHNLCKRCQRRASLNNSEMKSTKEKECLICGEKFTPKLVNQSICNRDHFAICGVCNNKQFISSKRDLNKFYGHYTKFRIVELNEEECFIKYEGDLREISCNVCKHKNTEVINFLREEKLNKYKQTCLDKYGVDNVIKMKETEQKRVKTYYKNYGVRHPMKIKSIAKDRGEKVSKSRIAGFMNGSISPSNKSNNIKGKHCQLITENKTEVFKSTWEFFFALLLNLEKIDYSYETLRLPYMVCNKGHTYIPDFIISDKIYEIKGVPKLDEHLKYKEETSISHGYEFILIDDINPIKERLIEIYGVDVNGIEKDIINYSKTDKRYTYNLQKGK